MKEAKVIEIWRPVIGYENWYSVSSLGRLRRDKPERWTIVGRILKNRINPKGYYLVNLCKNKIAKNFYVHRLVAIAFLGIKNNLDVNHKDGNKGNNNLSNLEWLTRSENHKHAFKLGLKVNRKGPRYDTKSNGSR